MPSYSNLPHSIKPQCAEARRRGLLSTSSLLAKVSVFTGVPNVGAAAIPIPEISGPEPFERLVARGHPRPLAWLGPRRGPNEKGRPSANSIGPLQKRPRSLTWTEPLPGKSEVGVRIPPGLFDDRAGPFHRSDPWRWGAIAGPVDS